MFFKKKLYLVLCISLLLCAITIPTSFSIPLELDLIEGGCAGYDTSLLELYYFENGSVVDSSEFEVTLYNGPIRGLGELDSFTSDVTPYRIEFDDATDYLYNIKTPNNSLYTELEGLLSIYECEQNPSQDKEELFPNQLNYESIFTIEYLTNSTQELSINIEDISNSIEQRIEIASEESNVVEYYEIQYLGEDIIKNISITNKPENELRSWILDDENNEWILSQNYEKNISLPTTLALEISSTEKEDLSGGLNSSNSTEEENQENLNSQQDSSSPDILSNENSFNNNEEQSQGFPWLIMLGVALIIIVIIAVILNSIIKKNKHKKVLDDAPLTLTQTKIMTYCDNYKHRYEPKEIVEQLVEQGYDREVVINTLWKYVEKENS